jgi:hypothetical protein
MTRIERMNADNPSKEEKLMLHFDVTEGILKAFYKVYNSLGYGFERTKKEVGLLLNFGAKPDFRRVVFTNSFQKSV